MSAEHRTLQYYAVWIARKQAAVGDESKCCVGVLFEAQYRGRWELYWAKERRSNRFTWSEISFVLKQKELKSDGHRKEIMCTDLVPVTVCMLTEDGIDDEAPVPALEN